MDPNEEFTHKEQATKVYRLGKLMLKWPDYPKTIQSSQQYKAVMNKR